jgi:hypothetical protein
MIVGEADGDDSIDGRPAHRPRQRPVQRADEVQAVALFLGGQRDALAERPEERVGEDHRQGLRREHPDREGLTLGQHSRHGVRPVAQRLRDLANPHGRLGCQPVRAVERE